MKREYFVYILASKIYGTLYIGVTNDLLKRVYEHKNKLIEGFTSKYIIDKLVYYDSSISIQAAIAREKQLKRWKRQWKINLIEEFNPEWKDLYENLLSGAGIPNRFLPSQE